MATVKKKQSQTLVEGSENIFFFSRKVETGARAELYDTYNNA